MSHSDRGERPRRGPLHRYPSVITPEKNLHTPRRAVIPLDSKGEDISETENLNRVFATVTQHMAGTRILGERTMRQPGHQRLAVQQSAGRLAVALVAAATLPAGLVACTIDTEASERGSAQQAASTETQTSLAAEEEAMQMPNPTPPNEESAMPDSASPEQSLRAMHNNSKLIALLRVPTALAL